MLIFCKNKHIIITTEPDTPLNDADHVGSFNLRRNFNGRIKKTSASFDN